MEELQPLIKHFCGSHRHMAHFPRFASRRHLAVAHVFMGGNRGEQRKGARWAPKGAVPWGAGIVWGVEPFPGQRSQ